MFYYPSHLVGDHSLPTCFYLEILVHKPFIKYLVQTQGYFVKTILRPLGDDEVRSGIKKIPRSIHWCWMWLSIVSAMNTFLNPDQSSEMLEYLQLHPKSVDR